MQECVKALEAQSRRNTVRESGEGGMALRLVLSEQGHPCSEAIAIQLLGFTEKAGLLHKPQLMFYFKEVSYVYVPCGLCGS